MLQDMTLQELWELFPIELTPHNPIWSKWAEDEIGILKQLLNPFSPIINHIGSTSIPNIYSKPIVDILVEVPSSVDFKNIINTMQGHNYICMSESETRISFNKGYTPEGYEEKVFHIHVHRIGDNQEIKFRDYLISHPKEAEDYERLKLSLLPKYKHDRDGYTAAKTPFIQKILNDEEFSHIKYLLSQRLSIHDIKSIVEWATGCHENLKHLWKFLKSNEEIISKNALWVFTHLAPANSAWIDSKRNVIIKMLLGESDTSKKRMLLQIIRNFKFDADNIDTNLLNFCLSKINSECEPYAIRCFSIYVAFNMCKHYPELIEELEQHLEMLNFQTLSPGLKSALRQTKKKIQRLGI